MTQQDSGRQRGMIIVIGRTSASVFTEAIRIVLEREYVHTEVVIVEETEGSVTAELIPHDFSNLTDALKSEVYCFKESRFTYDRLVSDLRHQPKRIPRNQHIPRRPFLRFTTRVKCTGKQQRKQKQRPKTPKQKRR